jgi:hypothetical protein
MSKDLNRPGVGLDIGTMNLVSARMAEGGKTSIRRIRDCFIDLDESAKKQLKMGKVDYIVEGDKLLVLGDSALTLANLFKRDLRRPLARGVVSAGELDAQKILSYLLHNVIGEPVVEGEHCYYSVPAAPVDQEGQDVIFHTESLRQILSGFGYTAHPKNEAEAVIYSQCAGSTFSGLAISYGSGMANIALAYQTVPAFAFSLSRGGDWIDSQTARALGSTSAKVCAIKERGVDLLHPKGREEEALVVYIRSLVHYTLQQTADFVRKGTAAVDLPEAVPLVVSGGTTRAKNFLDVFKQEFQAVKKKGFPIEVSDIVPASDPMTAVAEGLLVLASEEE